MERDEAISKLWQSLIEVEDYFQNGIMAQLQESSAFGGENAIPIKNAHLTLKTTGPFLPNEIFPIAEAAIETAADEFNKFLDSLRKAITQLDTEEAKRFAHKQLADSLDKFRSSLLPLRRVIPKSVADRKTTNVSISGNVYGQMNVAGESLHSPSLNITLNDLIEKIDSSEADETEKNDIKEKIKNILNHPLVASILGGASGAILG